jgi:hypothetical protein
MLGFQASFIFLHQAEEFTALAEEIVQSHVFTLRSRFLHGFVEAGPPAPGSDLIGRV